MHGKFASVPWSHTPQCSSFFVCVHSTRTRNVFYCYYWHACILASDRGVVFVVWFSMYRKNSILFAFERGKSKERERKMACLRSSFYFGLALWAFLSPSCINKCHRIMYVRPFEAIAFSFFSLLYGRNVCVFSSLPAIVVCSKTNKRIYFIGLRLITARHRVCKLW